MTKASHRAISCVLLLAGAIIVFAFCMKAVWISDDMDYGFVLTHDYIPIIERVTGDETPRHIENAADIVCSQRVHWLDVNGRAFAHLLIQFFCGIGGRPLFAVCNAAVFVAFILLVVAHAGAGVGRPRAVATAVGLYFLFFITHMTPAFQICYVWMFAVAMLWLLWLFSKARTPHWALPAAFVLGVLAGNGNEALCVGLSVAVFVWWLRNLRSVTPAQYVLIVGYAVGCAFLVFSPGNFARARRAGFSVLNILYWLGYGMWLVPLVIVMLRAKLHRHVSFRSMYASGAFWFDTLVACAVFASVLGLWANRMLFGAALASLVLTIRLLPRRGFSNAALVLTAVLAGCVLLSEWSYTSAQRAEYDRIEREFLERGGGYVQTSPVLPKMLFTPDVSYSYMMPISDSRMERAWRASFRSLYPHARPLHLVPSVMPGLDDSISTPYAEPFGPDVWVAVRPAGSSAAFLSHHSMGMGPVRRAYKTLEVDFSHPDVVAPGWEGLIVRCEYPFRFIGLDSLSVAPAASEQR